MNADAAEFINKCFMIGSIRMLHILMAGERKKEAR